MAIKTEMLRYFVEVAKSGNLAEAARNLGRTPSAVSMMLKQFEEHLGAPLFVSDRKNQLTPLGYFVLEEARRELHHFETTINAIMRFAETGGTEVRIGAISSIASAFFPTLIQKMHESTPNILVTINEMSTPAIIAGLRSEALDIGIVNDFQLSGTANIEFLPLIEERLGVLCQRDSLLGRKEKLTWSDLSDATLISNALARNISEPAVRKSATVANTSIGNSTSVQSYVAAGLGSVILPELVQWYVRGDLVFRIPEGNTYTRVAYLVWNATQKLSSASKQFCHMLRDEISDLDMAPSDKRLASGAGWAEFDM